MKEYPKMLYVDDKPVLVHSKEEEAEVAPVKKRKRRTKAEIEAQKAEGE